MLLQRSRLRRRRRLRPYRPHRKGNGRGGEHETPRRGHDVAAARPREGAGGRICSTCDSDDESAAGSRSSSLRVATDACAATATCAAPALHMAATTTTRRRRVRRRHPPSPTRRFGGTASTRRSRSSSRRRQALLLLLLVLVRPAASFAFVTSCAGFIVKSPPRLLVSAAPRRRDGDRRTSSSSKNMMLLQRGGWHDIPSRPSRIAPALHRDAFGKCRRRRRTRCGATRNDDDDDDDDDSEGFTRASVTADREGSGGSDGSSSNHDRGLPLSKGASGSSQLDVPPDELQRRAQRLREEASAMRSRMEQAKQQQLQKEADKADTWLENVLVHHRINADTEILNTVEQAQFKLVEGRYSPDQVDHMFERLCELSRVSGRDCLERNARLQLLVEATGKVDELEPEVNPNKRWKGSRVEHELHKKLFAKEWGIDLEKKSRRDENSKDEHDERYWRTRRR